jgi:outer membrane protein assembly factor BamB
VGQKTAVVVGSYDNLLYCFDALSGKMNWSFRTDNYVNGTPAIAGDTVVFGGCDARVRVLDLVRGIERGTVDTGAYIAGSVALVDGVAYVGNYGGRFLAIDTKTLSILWSYSLKTDAGFVGSPAVAGRFAVIGAKDSFLYCFDRKSGALLWKYRASAEILSSPLIGNDRVFIASSDGELSLLDLESGAVVSTYELGAGVKGSPAFASGFLAIGALDGNVYVFKGE